MIELGIPYEVEGEYPEISEKERFRHLFLIGESGTGKTTYLQNLIKQELDRGIIVIDPHGDLALKIASIAPKERLIYVDKLHPLCINPLNRTYLSRSEIAKEFIDVVNGVVKTAAPDQMALTVLMQKIIIKALKAFDDNDLSISHLGEFLEDKNMRQQIDDEYWSNFDKTPRYQRNEPLESAKRVSARLALFYENDELLPFIIGENVLDISTIANTRQIVVFNFSGFDDETTAFIGGIVASAIKSYWQHQAVINESPPLHFYADEYHLFITENYKRFLTDTRKYKISMNFSGHTLSQVDPALAHMMLSCYALVVMGVGWYDAEILSKVLRKSVDDILDIPEYEAIVSINKQAQAVMCFSPLDVPDYVPDKPHSKRQELDLNNSERTENISEKKDIQKKPPNFLRNTWIPA